MKLTIGMACHDDFHGVAFSIQSLALNEDLAGCEIVVIDNSPASPHGEETKKFCGDLAGRKVSPVRYVPMDEKTGTTQTRERIFAEARGQAVLVMDCHVLFRAGTIGRLKQWYASNPECGDLYSGPLILNHGQNFHTHFNDQWRGGMWGTWATAWHCTCRRPLQFTTLEVGESVAYRDLATSLSPVARCRCGREMPALGWAGHEAQLIKLGFQPLGFSDSDAPYEVPGQGLGVFSCRKAAWLGFNPHFRGFGGEELYIHTKYRQAGRKAICLPWLKWWHRFANPDGRRYPLTNFLKVRNYVLGHQELGLALDPVHQHFVATGDGTPDGEGPALSQAEWDFLIADPIGRVQTSPAAVSVTLQAGRPQPPAGATLDEIFTWCQGVPRDLDQHLPLLRDLAAKCEHVTEITKRRESTVGLLAGRPATLVSYQREPDILLKTLSEVIAADAAEREGQRRVERHTIHWGTDSASMNTIDETDLLFIDSVMSADRLKLELDQHAARVRRFLLVRGTGAFGEKAEGSDALGLFHALRPFVAAHPEWFIAAHSNNEYGITVLGRLPEDRPANQVHAWPPGCGPGTEFKAICSALDITMPNNCTCNALMIQMDVWGVAGCLANQALIVEQIKANQDLWGWREKFANMARAGFQALKSGLAWKINWLDPIPGLVAEAIRLAEAKPQEQAA